MVRATPAHPRFFIPYFPKGWKEVGATGPKGTQREGKKGRRKNNKTQGDPGGRERGKDEKATGPKGTQGERKGGKKWRQQGPRGPEKHKTGETSGRKRNNKTPRDPGGKGKETQTTKPKGTQRNKESK